MNAINKIRLSTISILLTIDFSNKERYLYFLKGLTDKSLIVQGFLTFRSYKLINQQKMKHVKGQHHYDTWDQGKSDQTIEKDLIR